MCFTAQSMDASNTRRAGSSGGVVHLFPDLDRSAYYAAREWTDNGCRWSISSRLHDCCSGWTRTPHKGCQALDVASSWLGLDNHTCNQLPRRVDTKSSRARKRYSILTIRLRNQKVPHTPHKIRHTPASLGDLESVRQRIARLLFHHERPGRPQTMPQPPPSQPLPSLRPDWRASRAAGTFQHGTRTYDQHDGRLGL
jgi:hypothetical protein